MLISIVIPLYNKGPHIARALKSALNQTYDNIELIVVDDGSTDESPIVVESFCDSRINLIKQANLGVSEARNTGIRHSKGELIAFLDADDEYRSNFLEKIIFLKNIYPDAGAYATSYEIIFNNGIYIPNLKHIPKPPWKGIIPSYFKAALGDPPICSSAVAIPKDVFLKVGLFPAGIIIAEDKDMWERIALYYKIAYDNTVGDRYYHDAVNRSCVKYKYVIQRPFIENTLDLIGKNLISQNIELDLFNYISHIQIVLVKKLLFVNKLPYNSRLVLSSIKPRTFNLLLIKYLLYVVSFMPRIIIDYLYRVNNIISVMLNYIKK